MLHYLNCVTRVTFVARVTMFNTLWFGVKRPDMCNIVTILINYYMKEENNNFQCQLSRIYFYMEKNPHLRDSPYITIPADV